MNSVMRRLTLIAVSLLAACAPAALPAVMPSPRVPAVPSPTSPASPAPMTSIDSPSASTSAAALPTLPPAATNVRVPDTTEYEIPWLLGFDSIPPVYDPRFAGAGEATLFDGELVIGISLGGEAKAYPVTVLRFREMVNDELAGIPILVTW